MHGPLRLACLASWLLAMGAGEVLSQGRITSADIAGQVVDSSGAALPEAVVTVTGPSTGLLRTAVTDREGRFTVLGVAPGTYGITAEAPGFSRTEREVVLTVGTVVEIRLELSLKGLAFSADVEAPGPLVDPSRTSLSTVVTTPLIEALPINVRNFISFALIAPGVASDRTPQQGSSATSGLTFAGQRARSNTILVDGFDNNDPAVGGVRGMFSQEVVREFQVIASSASAEYGKASGGIINIITRNGTNAVSGGTFFSLRNERLNAREHFERFDPSGLRIDREKAPYRQTQFGGSIGGPVRRDRTFYFAAVERLDISANNFVTIDDRSIVTVAGQPLGTPAAILRQAGFAVETGNVPYETESTQLFGRLDHRVTPNQAFDARINWSSGLDEDVEPWGGQVARSRGAALEFDDLMVAASHVWVASQSVVHDLRAQVAYRDQRVLALDPTCAGPCDDVMEGGPTVEVVGVASAGRQRFTPQVRETMRYQLLDTLTVQRGRQLLKFGIDYNYIDNRTGVLPLHFGGRYIFQALPAIPGVLPTPISSIQALALGLPAAYVQGYGNFQARYAVQDLSAFAQDDWRVTPTVTLKLGARYQGQFWPDAQYSVPGLDPYSFPSSHNVAPRLAAAWNPRNSRQTSLHAAYGRFFDNHLTSLAGIADVIDGTPEGLRTLVLRFPATLTAWNSPGRRLPLEAAGTFPSLLIAVDPELKAPYAHHLSGGIRHEIGSRLTLEADVVFVRGHRQAGTLDYNPLVPELGPNRRPDDEIRNGVAVPNTSASVLQYTSFGETWYRGLTLALNRRLTGGLQFLMSYTLSKAEDNSTDYQNAFLPENTGKGRNPADPTGLPIAFDPDAERGPSVQDQRHRFTFSGFYMLPASLQVSTIVTVGSGRPYNILAGSDLNGDGNGGAFPPDRARRDPSDPATSVRRNSGTLPMQASTDVRVSRRFELSAWKVEAIGEVFNLFNRTNYTEVNGIFGTGAYPTAPDSRFGQFEKAAPPLQAQVGLRLLF